MFDDNTTGNYTKADGVEQNIGKAQLSTLTKQHRAYLRANTQYRSQQLEHAGTCAVNGSNFTVQCAGNQPDKNLLCRTVG